MPTLPLPFPVLATGGDLLVRSADDVRAQYPEHVRRVADAPVRDALAEGAAAMLIAYQGASDNAAAQSDGTLATGIYLAAITGDVGIHPEEGEGDEALRDRYYGIPDIVTPDALQRLVDSILAPYTDSTCQIFESVLDRWYVGDGTTPWHSFVSDGLSELDPQYPDRRYNLRAQSSVGGAWAFDEHNGRYLICRVPVIDLAEQVAFAFDGTLLDTADTTGLFVSDGTVTDGGCNAFVFNAVQAAVNVYQAILNALYRARGAAVRIQLVIDPKL